MLFHKENVHFKMISLHFNVLICALIPCVLMLKVDVPYSITYHDLVIFIGVAHN